MSTYLQMQQRIADDLDRTDLSSQIQKAITRAIKHYSRKRFWFNETTGTFSTVADQEWYSSIPTDIKEIDDAIITVSTNRQYPLDRRTNGYINTINWGGNAWTGYPQDYAYFKGQIRLYPVPNDVYTITLFYQQEFAELSADADTNAWTTDAEDLIEARARWWLYKRVIRDFEEAREAKTEEAEALDILEEETIRQISTGRIRPDH